MLLPSHLTIQKLYHFTGHAAGVFALERGLEADTVLSGGGDGVIAQWNLHGGGDAQGIARVPGNIFSLLALPEHKLLLAGDLHGGLHVIDTTTRQEINRFAWDGGALYALAYLGNDVAALCSGTGNLILRDIRTHTTLQVLQLSPSSLRAIALHPDGQRMAIAASDHRIYILDRQNLQTLHIAEGHTNSVFSVAWSPDGRHLLSGSRDAQLKVWNAETYAQEHSIPAHMFTINDIRFDPSGRLFATAGRDKHVKIWDAERFSLLKVIDVEKYGGHINSVNKLFWSTSQNTLISCGDDRTVMGWEIQLADDN